MGRDAFCWSCNCYGCKCAIFSLFCFTRTSGEPCEILHYSRLRESGSETGTIHPMRPPPGLSSRRETDRRARPSARHSALAEDGAGQSSRAMPPKRVRHGTPLGSGVGAGAGLEGPRRRRLRVPLFYKLFGGVENLPRLKSDGRQRLRTFSQLNPFSPVPTSPPLTETTDNAFLKFHISQWDSGISGSRWSATWRE